MFFKSISNLCFASLNNKKLSHAFANFKFYSTTIMKVLNVAEKNDAAKNISIQLSRNGYRTREGLSKYNKIYEFNMRLWNENCQMIMTSLSGHLLGYEFVDNYRKWYGCQPHELFDAPVKKDCSTESQTKIKRTIQREVRSCDALIIWTDCDREGENIGFEIINVCKEIKPNIRIYRAKFSEITQQSINRAINTLGEPCKAISDAVDVRSELDLRIGAAFTRFQTLRLQKAFPTVLKDMLISYGSCQFPTLGFVVERFLSIEKFVPELYWKIKVLDVRNNISVEFKWARYRLFEKLPCQVFLDICQENPQAKIEKVTSKPKKKWRPLPLDTVELEKRASRKLHLNAKEVMRIAEKLYTQGFISYPRTETNIFPQDMNFANLVNEQVNNNLWGPFAQQLLNQEMIPRQGKKSDQAHPPIHPIKYAPNLEPNEAKVYEFIVRHFLACLSKDAEGYETIVDIDIAGEKFSANGLQILAKNYLEVYIYEKWSDKEMHIYETGQTFMPTSIEMVQEQTSPPSLLTEADLIALMDKHGIGTDATHAEHIDTIKQRQYIGVKDNKYLMPGKLGIGLVQGYDSICFEMSKPNLRAELENDLKLICEGRKDPTIVLQNQVRKYRDVFKEAVAKANLIDVAIAQFIANGVVEVQQANENVNVVIRNTTVFKCPKCGSNMSLKNRKQGTGKYIGCSNYPTCSNAIWFPESVKEVEVLEDTCTQCSGDFKKLKVQLAPNAFPVLGTCYTTCIGGCDEFFNTSINIRNDSIRRTQQTSDESGYQTDLSRNNHQRSNFTDTFTSDYTSSRNNFTSSTNSSGFTQRNQANSQNNFTQNNSMQQNNINFTSNDDAANNEIICNCHQPAKQMVVRKDGPNKGRIFYKCDKPQDSGCNFFLWGSSGDNNGQSNNLQSQFNSSSQNSFQNNQRTENRNTNNSEKQCNCRLPAKLLTVNKEGPNKGKQFYGCSKGFGGCNFFKWADEEAGGFNNQRSSNNYNSNQNNRNTGSYQRNAGNSRNSKGTQNSTNTRAKRKCGNCGTEGHTRKTCPNL